MAEPQLPGTGFLQGIDIVDAHHHFLQLDRFPFHWLAPDASPGRFGSKESLRRDFLPVHYLDEFSGLALSASVHVQANCGAEDPAEETRWLQQLQARTGWPSAIVGEAELLDPTAPELIARHLECPALRGIRTPVAWDRQGRWRVASQAGVMADAGFRRSLSILEANGLCLEVVVVPEQFDELAALARAHPGQLIVVDHFGTLEPDEPGNAQAWKTGIDLLADLPNVHVKLSGLWTVDRNWEPAVVQPYVRHLLDTIGAERILYGSNLPIETVNCSLVRQMSQLQQILAECSANELGQIFSDAARRVYRLV
ncbi:amidohydrolase family protein [Granulosicoccus sp. 3-233]|uniref:amidohydrolase family protein n=1 Tax=Granulosicoccus sp. 3-233 TaxID=3417969 RepID=UPI003D337475